MENVKHWLLRSSQDPTKYANTVRGIVMFIAVPSVLNLVNTLLGATILPEQVTALADQLAVIATQFSVIAGSVLATYGACMKVIAWINDMLVRRAQTGAPQ